MFQIKSWKNENVIFLLLDYFHIKLPIKYTINEYMYEHHNLSFGLLRRGR